MPLHLCACHAERASQRIARDGPAVTFHSAQEPDSGRAEVAPTLGRLPDRTPEDPQATLTRLLLMGRDVGH